MWKIVSTNNVGYDLRIENTRYYSGKECYDALMYYKSIHMNRFSHCKLFNTPTLVLPRSIF